VERRIDGEANSQSGLAPRVQALWIVQNSPGNALFPVRKIFFLALKLNSLALRFDSLALRFDSLALKLDSLAEGIDSLVEKLAFQGLIQES
jgi:hypothetical protein